MTTGLDPDPRRIASRRFWTLALLGSAGLAWCLLVPLPSTGASRLRRLDLLLAADDHARAALAQLGHPAHLAERLPVVTTALLVILACWGVGSAVLRGLRLGVPVGRAERVALAFAVGIPVVGGLTLALGRLLGLNTPAFQILLVQAAFLGAGLALADRWRRRNTTEKRFLEPFWGFRQFAGFAALVAPFVGLMGLGAMLPTVEFDALEYHLQGPKEYFLDGEITPLPHNVYTAMPFGVEMLTTLAMVVLKDWWLGALAGQVVIAACAPAAAVLIGGAATRLAGSTRAGWWAALIYLTTPWVFRLGNTPFVEGPLALMHAALVWAVVSLGWGRSDRAGRRLGAGGGLVGLVAGAALAIKYPGLVTAVVPASLAVAVEARRARSWRLGVGFAVGLMLTAGPWLLKNAVDHGNPVYPLAWSVFGGADWDAAREGRWQTAHGPRPARVDLLAGSLLDVAGRSDWQSPLYLALAPLAIVGATTRRRALGVLGLFAAYLFGTWWLLTHRLDRFWLPMLPVLAILAGLGAEALGRRSRVWLGVVGAIGWASCLVLCLTELAGPTAWTESYTTLRPRTYREGTPSLAALDALLPPEARPLVIGQAGTFGLTQRPIYNTVFDPDTLESFSPDGSPTAIAAGLDRRSITHVYVDWAEIERYRQPGNYGFTPFITPALFDRLVAANVLGPPTRVGDRQTLYEVRPLAAARHQP